MEYIIIAVIVIISWRPMSLLINSFTDSVESMGSVATTHAHRLEVEAEKSLFKTVKSASQKGTLSSRDAKKALKGMSAKSLTSLLAEDDEA